MDLCITNNISGATVTLVHMNLKKDKKYYRKSKKVFAERLYMTLKFRLLLFT